MIRGTKFPKVVNSGQNLNSLHKVKCITDSPVRYRYRISIVDISTLLKDIDIDMVIFENIDIDKAILENIDIDKEILKISISILIGIL